MLLYGFVNLLQCFSAGAVAGAHKKDHPYQLIVSRLVISSQIKKSCIEQSVYVSLCMCMAGLVNKDEGSFPLLVEDWGAIEEVLLLDAVEQDGFGNW